MGLGKKIATIIIIYLVLGLVWSVMRWMNFIPIEPGGLEGPLNILYIIFEPVSLVFFMIVVALGLF